MEKGLKLILTVDKAISQSYEIDETKLSQILGNLINNAIKYTETGQVTINISCLNQDKLNDHLRFTIADTGVGIPKTYYKEIFESFSQPKSITTRKHGGSGLGLAIVKKLVELHNSKVYVNSVVGQGSTFYFDIKCKRLNNTPVEKAKALDRLTNKTALLAEDNLINAMVARKLLSNWGVATDHAKDGLEAVEKSKLKAYDFILMDIHMPEMNGFDATKNIRQIANPNSFTPIFALTADITAEHQEEYYGFFNGFLRKPIEIDKLYNALVNTLFIVN